MAATIAALAEQALRRIGVAVVTVADRPALTAIVPVADIAGRALQTLGVVVTAASRPAASALVTVTDIAAKALQTLGVTVPASARPTAATVVAAATIATNALIALAVIASDETPSATDQALAVAKVNAIHDELVDQGIASWLTTAIPQAVSEDYTLLAAMHLAQAFGKAADPAQQPVIEARVRRIALVLQAQTVAEQRVTAVHDGLVVRGIVSWVSNAIPLAAFDDYVALTAIQMAPLFDVKADPEQQTALESRVRRTALVLQAQTLAQAKVAAVQDSLVSQGFVSWPLAAIPQAVAEEYTMLTALHLAPVFEVKADPAQQPVIETRVRKMAMLLGAVDVATNSVMSVHQDLSMRGKVRWSVFDIPAAVESVYVYLAANDIAPLFGIKANPADDQWAEHALARYIALPTSGERVVADYF